MHLLEGFPSEYCHNVWYRNTSDEVSQERLLFTVGLTTATLHWLEDWPKFTFRNFSLCRTWLPVWCLECAEMNTSPEFLKIYAGYLLAV